MISDKAVDVEMVANAITAEPLARIMFGGRELFHSNLIAWFCETMPIQATVVFDQLLGRNSPPVAESCSVTAQREWKHMDLVIRWANNEREPVVIENKVFSLPDLAQLDGYAAEIRKHRDLDECSAVLLSLCDPKFDGDAHLSRGNRRSERTISWRRVSYGALGDAIAEAISAASSDFATETIRHYAGLAENLDVMAALLEVTGDNDELVHMDLLLTAACQDRQLASSLSKLRARNVVSHIIRSLPESTLGRRFSSGFSNGSPLLEISYALTNTKRSPLLGWQLQGAQLRLTAVLPTLAGRTLQSRAEREQWGQANRAAFDVDRFDSVFGRVPLTTFPKKKPFNRFDPDFIYRYVEATDITVSRLADFARLRQLQVESFAAQLPSVPGDATDPSSQANPSA